MEKLLLLCTKNPVVYTFLLICLGEAPEKERQTRSLLQRSYNVFSFSLQRCSTCVNPNNKVYIPGIFVHRVELTAENAGREMVIDRKSRTKCGYRQEI